ncbi:fungal specific transcription factor domain-containing protein [Aspergillus mulundensis]|uniref:Transcription factor domain-containing protein n=1 Tax=Aspergillus mulundensis TaxID=1810919 RepID=A0A3D8SUJ2_9EURO|nr:hypothetical protein DSM5745_01741 [Aspergillus mulundensis]RDW89966.1 hypothetical protein DSM5745_01741 [Aspergillus mulundensis]
MTKVRKIGRTEVACAECRRRKLKVAVFSSISAGSQLTTCSVKEHDRVALGVKINNSNVFIRRLMAVAGSRYDLMKRIEILEEKLRSVSTTPLNSGDDSAIAMDRQKEQESPSQRTAVDEGVPVDILSTHALTEASDSEIGYFGECHHSHLAKSLTASKGPTSNYAMFRLLSKIFAQTMMMYLPASGAAQGLDPCHHCAQRHYEASNAGNDSAIAAAAPANSELYALPQKDDAATLLNGKPALLEEYHKSVDQQPPRFRKVLLALLNIVWAHAAASLGSPRQETFYERSVALLDSRTLERPSYELVQTLLLMVEYKQNHRRSISSYTTHALCVKAAFHIGLQSLAAARKPDENILRWRLVMGLTQGRPFLIPQSHNVVNDEIPSPNISDLYVAKVVASHPIIEQAVEALYNGNLERAEPPRMQTLSQWADLSWQIDVWSDSLALVGALISPFELSAPSKGTDGRVAARVHLSIQYYRMRMLVNFPLISQFLLSREGTSLGPRTTDHMRQSLSQIVQDDGDAVGKLRGIISALSNADDGFTSSFAKRLLVFRAPRGMGRV